MGGGHPLTSKVAVVSAVSTRPDADVDYLFLQVWPDRAEVSDNQNCGNLLAGVGPFALEEGLVAAERRRHRRAHLDGEHRDARRSRRCETPERRGPLRRVTRTSTASPGRHAPIPIEFLDVAGSTCGSLLPTGHAVDVVEGIRVTCVDNGMPVVCLAPPTSDSPATRSPPTSRPTPRRAPTVERVRLAAGPLMNLGDVTDKTVPKMTPARAGEGRRGRHDPHVHPPARARGDRRVRRGLGGDGVPHPRLGRPRGGRTSAASTAPVTSGHRAPLGLLLASRLDVTTRRRRGLGQLRRRCCARRGC